jgi:hypothetical protein
MTLQSHTPSTITKTINQLLSGVFITCEVIMYDDTYETESGDGYYPQVIKQSELSSNYVSRKIKFKLQEYMDDDGETVKLCWYQLTGIPIKGLDQNCGPKLYSYLNSNHSHTETRIYTIKTIWNSSLDEIYPK